MSNLLDKASIILTPTAYNNGEALCVKPSDGSGDFDFSRNSAATRVNAQGLVENVQILSSNLVQNGDFSEEGVQEVSNGSFSQEGAQLVTNGNFSNGSTNWNLGASWSIVNEKAVNNGLSNSFLTQNSIVQNGKSYLVSFDIADMTQGSLQLRFGSGAIVTESFTSNGTKTSYYVSSGDAINFYSVSGFDGSIDNVSVREVGQDWTLGTGWSIAEDKAVFDGGADANIIQSLSITTGNTFKITLDVSEMGNGELSVRLGGGAATEIGRITENGSYVFYGVSISPNITFRALSSFNGSITNISVKEVGQNWDLTGTWSIENQKATTNADGTTQYLGQSLNVVIGKSYKITYNILENTLSNNRLLMSGTSSFISTELPSNIGENSIILEATGVASSGYSIRFANSATNNSGVLSITNISVIEITDDTNLPRINYEGFSYDGSGNVVPNSGCGSWLFEPQSTNLVTYSEDINSWSKAGLVTISSNNATSPEGVQNASLILPNAGSGSFGVINSISKSSSLITYTLSGFAKEKDYNFLILRIDSGAANGVKGAFDLSNGTISTAFSTNGTGFTFIDAYIKPYTNNWYKYEVSFTTDSTTLLRTIFYVSDITGNGFSVPSYTANGTDGVLFWGAQLEEGSYATSYIPTSGSQVTRNQDLCNNGGSLASINSTSGTLYFEGSALANGGLSRYIALSNGSNNERVQIIYSSTANYIVMNVVASNSVQAQFTVTVPQTQYNKLAISYKANDVSFWLNGIKVHTDTNATMPIGLNVLEFQRPNNTSSFFGKTKAVAVWKEALSDQELAELTTI